MRTLEVEKEEINIEQQYDKKKMIEYFLREIQTQCEYIDISQSIINSKNTATVKNYALHGMFNAFGNISKILFPEPKDNCDERGEIIRNLLDINENTQFHYKFKNNTARKYRNILEHYDANFEKQFKKRSPNCIIDGNIGSIESFRFGDEPVLRHFDTEKYSFIFVDDEYEIIPALEESYMLYNKINILLKEGFEIE